MEGGISTSTRPTPGGESDGIEVGTDITVQEPAVLVQGRGGADDVLRILDDIADAVEESKRSEHPNTSRTFRKHEDTNEFQALVKRVTSGDAEVVLRKVFLYQGQCSVMQEIWIKDKKNPDAKRSPLKSYTVVHVHHHGRERVGRVEEIEEDHLKLVDAINARHISDSGRGYQGDNPFFATFIEPSGSDTLKVFPPDKEWTCSKCRQTNWRNKLNCRGRGGSCTGVRPCQSWKWQDDKSRDEGLARILASANEALQWKSRSKKSMARGGGDSAALESDTEMFVLEDLKQKYCLARCLRRDLRSPARRELPAEQDWSALDAPADARWPFTILFVGIDNAKDPDLKLKLEFEKIEQAYRESDIFRLTHCRVTIKRLVFSRWDDVMMEIRRERPAVLHFGCHAKSGQGLALFRQIVEPVKILPALLSWNNVAYTKNRSTIRLVVLNACESDIHALDFGGCVDFAIGHRDPVEDHDAIQFTRVFYDCLFDSNSLLDSFQQAKGCLEGYRLIAQRDPNKFHLAPVDISEASLSAAAADNDHNELVHFLKSEGLASIAAKFSTQKGMALREDLGLLKEEDFNDPGLSFLQRWQKAKLMNLVKKCTAYALSEKDSDLSGTDTASERSELASDNEDIDSEDEVSVDIVAAYHVGNADEILAHIKMLIHFDMKGENPLGEEHGNISFCTLVWMSFLRRATYTTDQYRTEMQKWLEVLVRDKYREENVAHQVHDFVAGVGLEHKLSASIREKMQASARRPCVGSIAVIDQVVVRMLHDQNGSLRRWQQEVVACWYEDPRQTTSDFLGRANRFLRTCVDTMQLLAYVQTQSYVVFLRMPKPASMLLFEYLHTRKLEHAAGAGAAADNTSLIHGFRMFVSSSKSLFSLTPADMPARNAMPTVIAGLECQSRLSEQAWQLLGPVKTINELFQEKQQENSPMSVPLLLETAKVISSAKSEPSSAEVSAAATAAATAAPSAQASTAQSRQLSPRVLAELREQAEQLVLSVAMPQPGSPSLTDILHEDTEDMHCKIPKFLPFEDFDSSTDTHSAISNITPGSQQLDKSKRVMSVFGIGIDIDKNLDRERQIDQSLRFGSGVRRVKSLHQKLFDASFDLSLVNCHFKKNPHDQNGLLDAIDEWKKELESSPLVPEVVLFFVSVHEFKETEDGSLYLMPSGKAAITDHEIEKDGVPFKTENGTAILSHLCDLERTLKRKPNDSKDLLFLLIIDTMTGPVLKSPSQLESSQIVIINTRLPQFSASDHLPNSLEREEKKSEPAMSHRGSRGTEKPETVVPTASAIHPVELLLDRIFEPGMALGRSLQQLEEDCDSIENWKSIPEDFALRKSCKFEWRLDREYIHMTISHVMPSTTPEMDISENEKEFKNLLIGTIKAQVEESKSRFAGLSIISQPFQSLETESEGPSGLKWENTGNARPSQGREITNSLLANTLPSKTKFSQVEWKDFGIHNLHIHSFIKSGASYFKPASALMICSPQSGYVSRCEDQIFSILTRSLVYVPLLNLDQGFRLQEDRCSLVLLQHILAIELLGRKESALRAIFPVMLTASAQQPADVGLSNKNLQATYKVARILLRRIGIDLRERTVPDIFSELMNGHKTVSLLSIARVDMQVETKKLAQLMLEEIDTQIENFHTANLKVCCPQGEEVINWLQFIGWETLSAVFAARGLASLPQIMNLSENTLLEICQERVETDSTLLCTKEELYTQLYDCRSELKNPSNKFHEESKTLQDRLDGFRDKEISWAKALFAQHSMEILVTKPLSLVLLFLLSVGTAAFLFVSEIYQMMFKKFDPFAEEWPGLIRYIFGVLLTCALLPFAWILGLAPWKLHSPKIVTKKVSFWLGMMLLIFCLRQVVSVALCFVFKPIGWHACPGARDMTFILECVNLSAAMIMLLVLVIRARYFVIISGFMSGLILTVSGSVYFAEFMINFFGQQLQIVIGGLVLVSMMLLVFRKYVDDVKLKKKQMEPMKEFDQEWHKLLQGRKVTFVRAKIVCPRNTEDTLLEEQIKGFATDFHISRVRTSRAGPSNASWFIMMLARIRAMVGTRVEIAISVCAKRNCSEDCLQQDLHSAMGALLQDRLTMQLSTQAHRIPASLAKLNILCDKIKDERSAQILQEVAERKQEHTQRWPNMPGLTRKSNIVYSLSGKRLQHEQDINTLFRDAQRLNNIFHTEIKSFLQSDGDSCEFIPGPIKTPSRAIEKVVRRYHRLPSHLTDLVRCRIFFRDFRSILDFVQGIHKKAWDPATASPECVFKIRGLKNRLDPDCNSEETFGFRDLQFNLELGFKDAHIVPCQEWEAAGVQRHICEVQLLPRSFSEVLRKHEYRILRDIAGK